MDGGIANANRIKLQEVKSKFWNFKKSNSSIPKL